MMTTNWKRIHQFTAIDPAYRTVQSDPITDTLNNYIFTVVDVPYLLDMSQKFEYYRLERVDVKYQPFINQVMTFSGEGANTFTLPNLASTFDPYSSTIASFSALVQRGDARVSTATTPWSRSIRPVPLLRAFDTALVDGFVDLGPQWITRDRPDVPHYGFWIALEPSVAAGPTPSFGGRITFHLTYSFRNPVGSAS
jgi:hypothetical protein